ncbi:hypothetical protein B7W89_19640 [Agrobacterium tumefaciens]|uniref:hypothetical protein n=1 Tax=Agrobacterium tumefaciens TaxID=358 RepID=UPI000B3F6FB0|nr:hypothetical protein [Agrobacterium tumefaciens]NSY03416.1 hypothetical protein [Agrobacterium tumefaciens]OVE88123.1 hypothetical protein B7W89_19640 [Agrobacterium tumefaciens]
MRHLNDLVDISYYIPPIKDKGRHHVISQGQSPTFYRPEDLRDKGEGKTAWVDAFEKLVVALFWATGKPVPYAFRTPDGLIRSLDAGCLKMLLNRNPPDLILACDHFGFVDTVEPSKRLQDLYGPIRANLINRVYGAKPTD